MSDWDARDSGLLLAALTGVYADTKSTKEHLKRGGEETNPLLPRNPSGQDLDKASVLSALIGGGAAGLMEPKWRRPMLGAWAGLEHGLAYKNEHRSPSKKKESLMESGLEGPLMMAALGGLLGHYLNDSDSGISVEKKDGAISLVFNKKF